MLSQISGCFQEMREVLCSRAATEFYNFLLGLYKMSASILRRACLTLHLDRGVHHVLNHSHPKITIKSWHCTFFACVPCIPSLISLFSLFPSLLQLLVATYTIDNCLLMRMSGGSLFIISLTFNCSVLILITISQSNQLSLSGVITCRCCLMRSFQWGWG